MISGIVHNFEPIIPLSVCGSDGKVYQQNAIVDTGFDGWLSLPPDLIAQLDLKWKRRGRAILADGSECLFNVYEAIVIWDGQFKVVDVAASESEPLLGMSLLYGFKLQVEAVERGIVTIESMR